MSDHMQLISDIRRPVTEELVAILHGIRDSEMIGIDPGERAAIGQAMHRFLSGFCDPNYEVPDNAALVFLQANTLIANCMAALETTTDSWIHTLHGQPQQGFKTIVLYSARNELTVDFASLLSENPSLVSHWLYHTFQVIFSGAPNKKVMDKLISFVNMMDDRLVAGLNLQEAYFGVTYTGDIAAERHLKGLINNAIRKVFKPEIILDPDPTKVAVWADFWSPGHSVYRSLRGYVEALKPDHHLTLIHCTRKREELDTSLFDEVITLKFDESGFDLEPLKDKKFGAAVFCDVCMTTPSILLSNVRIAPLQVMLTGHPVSTFGGEMDYFLSGDLVESGLPDGHESYSEKLLVLPGYGATHTRPTYELKGRKKTTDAVIINCSWLGQKCHHECLAALNRAIERSGEKVIARFFPGQVPAMHKGVPAFIRDLNACLPGARVEVLPMLEYDSYMELMEEGDFNVDCFPFGGSNTASDAIHLGKPLVSLMGNRWFNRIGPSMVENFSGYMPPDTVEEFEYCIADMIKLAGVDGPWLSDENKNYDAVYEPQSGKEFNEWIKKMTRGVDS